MMTWMWVILFQSAWATPPVVILVQGPAAQTLDYASQLKAHSDWVSPSQYYQQTHPTTASREHLLRLFAEAQKAFLDSALPEARLRFAEVLSTLSLDDWAPLDREIFLQSYLRLAQMEETDEKRDRWLRDSLRLGSDVHVDSALYPPPLLARRNTLAAQVVPLRFSLNHLPAGWKAVLVDGRLCARPICTEIAIFPGQVRMTWLSDQWLPQSHTLASAEVERTQPKTVSWFTGSCDRPKWDADTAQILNKRAYWGDACGPMTTLPTLTTLNQPVQSGTSLVLPTESKEVSPALYKSPWVWGGLALVATVAVIVHNSQHHESKEPTTTYGYQ